MVARVNHELFSDAMLTPEREASDSPDLLHALETARGLEARGARREAAQWLRRAVDEAEKQGNDVRVLVLARAAADLTSRSGPVSLAAAPSAGPASQPVPMPPMLAALVSSMPPSRQAVAASQVVAPSAAPTATATAAAPAPISVPIAAPPTSVENPITERRMRIGAFRVAIAGSMQESSFTVHRLATGQAVPPGMIEAMLVLTGGVEGRVEIETHVPVATHPAAKP